MDEQKTPVFVDRLTKLMDRENVSQTELAERSGVSQPAVSRLLKGQTKKCPPETMAKLADVFGKQVEELTVDGIAIRRPETWRTMLQTNCVTIIKLTCGALVDPAVGTATGGPIFGGIGAVTGACRATHGIFKEVAKLDLPELGWVLNHQAMCRACAALLSKAPFQKRESIQQALESVAKAIDKELERANIVINADFALSPGKEFSNRMQARLEERLISIGFNEQSAKQLASSLPLFYHHQLQMEYREGRENYQRLFNEVRTPFDEAAKRERTWSEYRSALQVDIKKPLFEQTFSLVDVRQKIRCVERVLNQGDDTQTSDHDAEVDDAFDMNKQRSWLRERKEQQNVHLLEDRLESWIDELFLNEYRAEQAIMFVTGGPGSGKSTEARFFAGKMQGKRLANGKSHLRVLFVPLHQFTYGSDLVRSLNQFCEYHEPPMPVGLLDRSESENPLLIVFDGLDELAKEGGTGQKAAADFVDDVTRWVGQRGITRQLAVLFCGRPISVSGAVTNSQKKFVLELLPYFIDEDERREFTDPARLLEEDQRDSWWKQFQVLNDRKPVGMPEELRSQEGELQELTSQPLLNYLVSLSREKGFDFKGTFNRNELYRHMIERVIQRPYSGAHAVHEELKPEEIVELLETVALAAWDQSGRAVSLEQAEPYFSDAGQIDKLECLSKDREQSLLQLFVGFYLESRQLGAGKELFEFTHKSFGEYLAVRKMIDEVDFVAGEWERNQKSGRSGFDTRAAVAEMGRLFGPTRLTVDLVRFFKDEFQACDLDGKFIYDDETLARLRKLSVAMINHVARYGMPMEDVKDGPRAYVEMDQWAKHAEEALFVLHETVTKAMSSRLSEEKLVQFRNSNCGKSTVDDNGVVTMTYDEEDETALKRSTRIVWPERTTLGTWLQRLIGMRESYDVLPVLTAISWFPLSKLVLRLLDLVRSNLGGANLGGANLGEANLYEANLGGAYLGGAYLGGAYLDGANLGEANLYEANLGGAYLGGAYLGGANLGGAYLDGAYLDGADLRSATVSMRALSMTRGKPAFLPDGTVPKDDNWRKTYRVE